MDNKITNDKLKKLTEEVSNLNPTDFCNVMHKFALDIINRLQAELEVCNEALDNSMKLNNRLQADKQNLEIELKAMRGAANSLKMHYEEAQAEVERLKRELDLVIENSISARYPHCVLCGNGAILTKSLEEYDELIADISAEAYKEFAERLKKQAEVYTDFDEDVFRLAVGISKIDNLVKEMVDE